MQNRSPKSPIRERGRVDPLIAIWQQYFNG